MGAAMAKAFPCMSGSSGVLPGHITITVRSTSACCQGQIRTVSLPEDKVEEFKEMMDKFMDEIRQVHQSTPKT